MIYDTFNSYAKYLRSQGFLGQTNEVWIKWLNSLGFTGSFNEAFYNYLGSVGYVGSLSDRYYEWKKFSIVPVTHGMALTEAWVTRGTGYNALSSATSASVRVDATISNTDDGILMEAGGVSVGLIMYVYSGVLYFQCGNGAAFGTTGSRSETSYTLPVGEFNYVVEWSADTSNAVLYVNGLAVDSQVFSNALISGSDAGTVGRVKSTVAVNRGGWTADAAGDYTNTITKCDIFNNQLTADV